MTKAQLERLFAITALERLPDPPDLCTPAGIGRGAVPRLTGRSDRWLTYALQARSFFNWKAVERRREAF
jgi:hypothetical protein